MGSKEKDYENINEIKFVENGLAFWTADSGQRTVKKEKDGKSGLCLTRAINRDS